MGCGFTAVQMPTARKIRLPYRWTHEPICINGNFSSGGMSGYIRVVVNANKNDIRFCYHIDRFEWYFGAIVCYLFTRRWARHWKCRSLPWMYLLNEWRFAAWIMYWDRSILFVLFFDRDRRYRMESANFHFIGMQTDPIECRHNWPANNNAKTYARPLSRILECLLNEWKERRVHGLPKSCENVGSVKSIDFQDEPSREFYTIHRTFGDWFRCIQRKGP